MITRFIGFLTCLYVWAPISVIGAVQVYQYPEKIIEGELGVNRRSEVYNVQVEQAGVIKRAYVMHDRNQEWHHNSLKRNPDHHWTNFSMSGEVRIKVSLLNGDKVRNCTVYPLKKKIRSHVENGEAVIELNETDLPLQMWVDVEGPDDQVLLVFADPIEQKVPDQRSEDVVVIFPADPIETVYAALEGPAQTVMFAPGIHNWGNDTGKTYAGYRMPILDGKEIYIPGGAYVVGSFEAKGSGNWTLHGRGVLSGCGKERLPDSSSIPWSMVHASNADAKNQKVEGIVSVCPPHFNLTFRGQCVIDNVKMFGWWYQTDGTVTGDHSIVRNCFFKVMDDFIKVYSDHCLHENNTMFHGINGAPFQFTWGNHNGDNNIMRDTYIVHSSVKQSKPINNTTVINARVGKQENVTENNIWQGLYIDNGCNGFIGINANGGTYRNFIIKDVELNSGIQEMPQFSRSYLVNGNFDNLVIENMRVDGNIISGIDPNADNPEEGKLWVEGDTSALQFK